MNRLKLITAGLIAATAALALPAQAASTSISVNYSDASHNSPWQRGHDRQVTRSTRVERAPSHTYRQHSAARHANYRHDRHHRHHKHHARYHGRVYGPAVRYYSPVVVIKPPRHSRGRAHHHDRYCRH